MKIKIMLNILYLFTIFLFISISHESPVQVIVEAKTGIINKEIDSTKFSFEIECEVNQNITNNITQIDIFLTIKELIDSQTFNSICNIKAVRVLEENKTITTNLICTIENSQHALNEETFLVISSSPTQEPSDIANFTFLNFDEISNYINLGGLTLNNLEEDNCKNNNFMFEININNIDSRPLLSTICKIKLNDESHPEANCAIPIYGQKIKCFVDVSETKYIKDDNITIKAQNLIPCENGQILKITNNANNILIIQEECGEIINNYNNYFYFNILFSLFLLSIIL